jgi:hypothetical protein
MCVLQRQTLRTILDPESKMTNTATDRDRCTSLLAVLGDHPIRYSVHLFTVRFGEIHNSMYKAAQAKLPTQSARSLQIGQTGVHDRGLDLLSLPMTNPETRDAPMNLICGSFAPIL